MLAFPPHLFRIDARDEQSAVLSEWEHLLSISDTDAFPLVDTPTVASNMIVFVSHLYIHAAPGAGQVADSAHITKFAEGGVQNANVLKAPANGLNNTTADVVIHAQGSANVILLPGEYLRAQGFFNSGVASNTVRLAAYGFQVPRGNMLQA